MLKVYQQLDPGLVTELSNMASLHDTTQGESDNHQWNIAAKVNDDWDEHKSIFGTKKEYYVACSFVLNKGRKKRYFGVSGETLRRYCDLQESYSNLVPEATDWLDALTMDHLFKARKLANMELVSNPREALAMAYSSEWSADEMVEHYDPPAPQPEHKPGGFINKFMTWTAPLRKGWDDAKKASFDADVKSLYERYFK